MIDKSFIRSITDMQTIHDSIIHIDLQYVKGFGMFPQQDREIVTFFFWFHQYP